MGQIQFTISLVLITLFTIAVIGFATNFATDNSAAIDLSADSQISGLYSSASSNASDFSSESESTYASIVNATISPDSGSVQSIAPFTLTASNALGTTQNIVKVGYVKIFGNDSGFGIFLTAFFSMLVLIAGLFFYKTLRGFPD